ncbi:MAG: UDP-3-O-3-hydroxymyristoyl glucosamine N-acyltransferase [Bacteroidetes bacterium]|nr:MAG: UDP-3-O-3-hydroxymyristoyl glucosamine N-acyltransferase [Bacteroidota bacterium]
MKFTASEIAAIINGKVDGNPAIEVNKLSKIEQGEAGSVSFLGNPKYTQFIYTTQASVVIVNDDFKPEQEIGCTLIRVENAYNAFAIMLDAYNKIRQNKTGISKHAYIPESASIGENCYIAEFVSIGEYVVVGNNSKIYPNAVIGDNVIIGESSVVYAGVKIYNDCSIGSGCTLHAGVVIGADGFGFAPQSDNQYQKVAQIGNVIIEDNVEIGANTTIDRATLGSTIIRKGVKIDNLIQIAHNVEIGENTVIAAQSGVAGSAKIGKNCMIAGQVGIIGHLEIGDNVKIAAQSGISTSVPDNAVLMGSPAFDISMYRKSYVHFRNLTKLADRLNLLEKKAEK